MAKTDELQKTVWKELPVDAVDQAELAKARDAVDRIFKVLGVKKVVVVDDELNTAPEVGDLIARYKKLHNENPKRVKSIPELKSVTSEGSEDDVRQDLQEVWNALKHEEREILLMKLDWIPAQRTFSTLSNLLANYRPTFLSLAEWKKREQELTAPQAVAESLLLFDLDMSKEHGAIDEGMRIIKALLVNFQGRCQCGLLSHLVQKDSEFRDWQKYTDAHGLQQHQGRFVVISKKHLPASPMVFAQRLKRAAITSPCDELRREVEQVLDRAFTEAKGDLAKLNVYDFEEIIFQSSYAEGVWEPDTVLRILALYTQRSARKLLKANETIKETASRVRSVIDIGYRPADAPAPSSREIMRLENYEDEAFLRDHHIPLDLGDIFRTLSGVGEFILLAQPCDIMCRNEEAKKRLSEVLVAPVIEKPLNDKTFENSPAYWKLDVYSLDEKKAKYVDFHGVRAVPILALDLTVFDTQGKASFRLGQDCPANVIPSWRLRYDAICEAIGHILKRYENSVGGDAQAAPRDAVQLITDALTMAVSKFLSGTLDPAKRTLTYDIQRVGRLKPPRAASLLRAFTAFIARDGFDHDLTRTIAERPNPS